jgi:16S rRNA (guanine527-N7)-methyltransferase
VVEDELRPWVERHGWDPGADAYARLGVLLDLWARYGSAINLHGARTREDLVRHVQDGLETALCVQRAMAVVPATRWLDVGSGGGFPALVVAASLPCAMTAVEPRQRRASFLELAFAAIESKSSRVIRARFGGSTWNQERIAGLAGADASRFEVASARAVWPHAAWLELGKTLVARPGFVVVHGAISPEIALIPHIEVAGTFSPIRAYCFT